MKKANVQIGEYIIINKFINNRKIKRRKYY